MLCSVCPGLPMTTAGITMLLLTTTAVVVVADDAATWRGLVVAAEDRCSEYVRGDYRAAADEEEIAKNWGRRRGTISLSGYLPKLRERHRERAGRAARTAEGK